MLIAQNLHKTYRRHATAVPVLVDVNLEVDQGEFLSIIGASGSGKSTLMHLLGTLDQPDTGSVYLDSQRIDDLSSRDRDALRNRTFGFIFQAYHLLPELTALENVLAPVMVGQSIWSYFRNRREHRMRALALLDQVGLSHRLKHRPRELSGGEMQRTAIARALMSSPRILLADEPTGNLDAESGGEVVRILRDLHTNAGVTIIMVTHNLDLVKGTDRVIRLTAGRLDSATPTITERDDSHEHPRLHQRQAV